LTFIDKNNLQSFALLFLMGVIGVQSRVRIFIKNHKIVLQHFPRTFFHIKVCMTSDIICS
jgi:hypothetical protein